MFFDTHAHLTGDGLFENVDAIIARAHEANVSQMVNICTDIPTLLRGLELADRYPFIKNACAIHPHDVDKSTPEDFEIIKKAASDKKLVAIGETGLDYHYTLSSKSMQQKCLKEYAKLAKDLNLALIIHCREAYADLFSILNTGYKKVILHCFTGTKDEAQIALQRGWYLSFSGIVTFKKSEELRDIARMTPLNQLLIETDAPFLAPTPHRGKMNEPSFLPLTAKALAEEKKISLADFAKITLDNALEIFG